MNLKKAVVVIGIIIVLILSPFGVAASGLSYFVEDWALERPDSGFAEWTARSLFGMYQLVLRKDKRVELGRKYLDVFSEDNSQVYDEDRYKDVYWRYARSCTYVLREGKRGIGYYRFAEDFPDDPRAGEAMEYADKFGYRDALYDGDEE
ncbi:MAG: hypothetical protein JW909_08615 [Planctomycetes bacterium]|nr:hypothetical protein [Planctomycetota bacterium]